MGPKVARSTYCAADRATCVKGRTARVLSSPAPMAALAARVSFEAIVADALPRRVARLAVRTVDRKTLGAREPREALEALANARGRAETVLARLQQPAGIGAACAACMVIAVVGWAIPVRE
eukprot:5412177-Prymnesium_polylepis.2